MPSGFFGRLLPDLKVRVLRVRRSEMMEGVEFVTDEKGHKVAV